MESKENFVNKTSFDQPKPIKATVATVDKVGPDLIEFIGQLLQGKNTVRLISSLDCPTDKKAEPAMARFFGMKSQDYHFTCSMLGFDPGSGFRIAGKDTQIIQTNFFPTPQHAFSPSINPPPKDFNVPGTPKDWNAFALFHEAQHQRDIHANPNFVLSENSEDSADAGARIHYQEALKKGIVSDPDVPDAWRGMRVLADIQSGYSPDKHTLAIFEGIPGFEHNDDRDVAAQKQQSVKFAKNKIFETMSLQDAKANPALFYIHVQGLYKHGVFDQDRNQKAYVGEFLRTAETYGVDHFKTGNQHTVGPLSQIMPVQVPYVPGKADLSFYQRPDDHLSQSIPQDVQVINHPVPKTP